MLWLNEKPLEEGLDHINLLEITTKYQSKNLNMN